MAERGYERASVAAIASAAGLTPGLVHYHFRNKEAVLLALLDHLEQLLAERVAAASVEVVDPRDLLDAYIDGLLAKGPGANPRAVACWVAVGTEALTRPAIGEAYRRLVRRQIGHLRDRVQVVLEDEGNETESASAIAAGIFAAVEGAFRLATLAPGSIPEGSAADTVKRMAAGLL